MVLDRFLLEMKEKDGPNDLNTKLSELKGPMTCNENNVKKSIGH